MWPHPSSNLGGDAALTPLLPLCGLSWWSPLGPLPGLFIGREGTGGSEAPCSRTFGFAGSSLARQPLLPANSACEWILVLGIHSGGCTRDDNPVSLHFAFKKFFIGSVES